MFVTFRGGAVRVVRSKILLASSDEAARLARDALRKPQAIEDPPKVEDGVIIEGVIRKLRRGTDEFDRRALSFLPDAFITED